MCHWKWIIWFVVDAQLVKEFNSKDAHFQKNIHIFRHLKLEIALAIPASNDEKYNQFSKSRVNIDYLPIIF